MNKDVQQVIDRIIHSAARAGNVSVEELLGRTKRREVTLPRQLAMYKMMDIGWNQSNVGRYFSRSHATVNSACRMIECLIGCGDDELRSLINKYNMEYDYDKRRAEGV